MPFRDLAQAWAAYGRMAAYTSIIGQGEMPPRAFVHPPPGSICRWTMLVWPHRISIVPHPRSGQDRPVADPAIGHRLSRLPAMPGLCQLEMATRHPGSWWLHWLDWIQPYAGPQVSARVPGDGGLQPLEEAPGSYVKVAGIE